MQKYTLTLVFKDHSSFQMPMHRDTRTEALSAFCEQVQVEIKTQDTSPVVTMLLFDPDNKVIADVRLREPENQ